MVLVKIHNMIGNPNKKYGKKIEVNGETVHKDRAQRVPVLDVNDKPIEDTQELEELLGNTSVIGRNLCEEIELLLRHRDNENFFSDIYDGDTKSNRFFYTFDEANYLKNNEMFLKKTIKN